MVLKGGKRMRVPTEWVCVNDSFRLVLFTTSAACVPEFSWVNSAMDVAKHNQDFRNRIRDLSILFERIPISLRRNEVNRTDYVCRLFSVTEVQRSVGICSR